LVVSRVFQLQSETRQYFDVMIQRPNRFLANISSLVCLTLTYVRVLYFGFGSLY